MNDKPIKKIRIYGLDNDAKDVLKATCALKGAAVECIGDEIFVEHFEKYGAYNQALKKTVYHKYGQNFLNALPNHFNSGYLTAVPYLTD